MADEPNDTLAGMVARLLIGGRSQIERAAERGRSRLRVRAVQRDLDHFWIRLGKTAYRLVESGEVSHPGLDKAVARIRALEEELAALERAEGVGEDEGA